ncbi:MAG TPA: VOC family protein [Gemmatimonadales bacterium]|jgi:catechol 2,3-dioxygenase-like lactoylglutathione lyase family enzyme|nr:VOC family protein [Gemmatimonadales bacterium]
MKLLQAIPALPVKDIARSVAFYRDQLEFVVVHQEDGFAIVRRDAVEVHLWAARDERWRSANRSSPVVSGAESFIAGTASCRIGVTGVDELHRGLAPRGVLHPNGPLGDRPWGTREFAVLDLEGNLLTFFERL